MLWPILHISECCSSKGWLRLLIYSHCDPVLLNRNQLHTCKRTSPAFSHAHINLVTVPKCKTNDSHYVEALLLCLGHSIHPRSLLVRSQSYPSICSRVINQARAHKHRSLHLSWPDSSLGRGEWSFHHMCIYCKCLRFNEATSLDTIIILTGVKSLKFILHCESFLEKNPEMQRMCMRFVLRC